MSRLAVAALLLTVLQTAGCWSPVREPDCLLDGKCECKTQEQCQAGFDCVDGFCRQRPDLNPGDLGWPCAQDSECNFRVCLPKGPGNGGVCSQSCNTADAGLFCPRGYECRQALDRPGFVCTPPLRSLCLSCASDLDCNAAGDRCVGLSSGSHCLEDCALRACPEGYECRALGLDAGTARVCTPASGSCECSTVNVGLARSCKRTNPMATCFGFERCQADGGFSGCDALLASRERCNGIDDDCDGLFDDDDPDQDVAGLTGYPSCTRGSACRGAWYCGLPPDAGADAGKSFQCSAPPLVSELCNGLDDDCDGVTDEDFKDATGALTGPRACGTCELDCTRAIPGLAATDAGVVLPGAVDCVQAAGGFRCVPRQCAAGYFPWPPGTPQLCQRDVGSQCQPCTSDADCRTPGDTCSQLQQDVGRYCLEACDTQPCPAGSTCTTLGGRRLCQPNSQSCSCTPATAGFTRSCLRTAGAAVCIGQQVCRADGGFDACDTSLTALELCDGLDNDCDGVADQPFIDTLGSGRYDSDEHCGNCTTNCKAQWSPTIQHALGGCRLDAGLPQCRIVQCTSDVLAGGKLCQLDADCGPGQSCHPLFRQCLKPCAPGCAANEQCLGGACTARCTTDSTCTSAYGPLSRCGDAGACVAGYQFFDSDRESTNGCECPAPAGVIDVPDTYSSYPSAGQPYVDRDCDGVDGRASRALYVWAQSPQSLGTRASPFRTLAEGLAAFSAASHDHILVAQGSYTEQVVLKNGVKLFGGYSSDFSRRDVVTFPTLIEAPQPDFTLATHRRGSVNAENLTSETVLAGFTIRGYDVITRAPQGSPGFNSYAVFSSGSPGLQLLNDLIVGGRAGDASPAAAGTSGATGQAGARGRDARECSTTDCANESQAGGAAGTNPSCTQADAIAGGQSNPNLNPQPYPPGGLNGQGGSNGIYQHSDPMAHAAFCKYDCTVPPTGLNGLPASNGGDGTPGTRGGGCSSAAGGLAAGEWRGQPGAAGTGGLSGIGGGGGGAGGCVRNATPATCTIGRRVGDLGSTGGGGGAGGCGGSAGSGGAPGGGSFGVFVTGGLPKIAGNVIEPGFGGRGGSGGAGGYGGLGGPGGAGGDNNATAWCAGKGGAGGRGGNGGAGAGGGGGCGGVSFGVAGANIGGAGYDAANTLRSPPINAAGQGGAGGASPAGVTAGGQPGAAGVTGTSRSF